MRRAGMIFSYRRRIGIFSTYERGRNALDPMIPTRVDFDRFPPPQ